MRRRGPRARRSAKTAHNCSPRSPRSRKRRARDPFGNVVFKRYFKHNPWAQNPNAGADRKRFEKTLHFFGIRRQYDFDELMLVAQGYQESQLDQATQNPSGAVGVMQIKPSTAKSDPVNIVDIKAKMENNIHAGVKYLRHLADDHFGYTGITPLNRHLFASPPITPARRVSRHCAARHQPRGWTRMSGLTMWSSSPPGVSAARTQITCAISSSTGWPFAWQANWTSRFTLNDPAHTHPAVRAWRNPGHAVGHRCGGGTANRATAGR